MFLSIKHRKSISYTLVGSLVVAGLIQSVTRHGDASDDATPTQFTSTIKESNGMAAPDAGAVDETTKARVSEAFNKLPMRFEENRGQVNEQVKFVARNSSQTLFLTPTEAVLVLFRDERKKKAIKQESISHLRSALRARPQPSSMSVVRMKLHGANPSPRMSGEKEFSAQTNYFIGNDPQQWQTNVVQYERVRYEQAYPGIDLIYYGQEQSFEYDFEVAPGADPERIRLGFTGVRKLKIEAATGDLLLQTAGGEIRQKKPVTYQEINGERQEVESRYVIKGKKKVGFKLGDYDHTKPLVIDPTVLSYSTYLGGMGSETSNGIAVDASGNIYVVGSTNSTDFPLKHQLLITPFNYDVFVTKLNPKLVGNAQLIYSTYLGGGGDDEGYDIAVDSSGHAYVTGSTRSGNFPLMNQFQTTQSEIDAFVTRLNTNLIGAASLIYSTHLGGMAGGNIGRGIAINSAGHAYVTGITNAPDFPTKNPFQATVGDTFFGDGFVTRLTTNAGSPSVLIYSTFLGGTTVDESNDIAVDSAGHAYVTGNTASSGFPIKNQFQTNQPNTDAFVTRLNTNLAGAASLIYSTYLGGNAYDFGKGISVDQPGDVFVTGTMTSTNFPVKNQYQTDQPHYDGFVTRLNINLTGNAQLIYSTYLGGNNQDVCLNIKGKSTSGIAYVTGYTDSTNFPTKKQYQAGQGASDSFVTILNTKPGLSPTLIFSTYLGGNDQDEGHGIAHSASQFLNCVYVTGYTNSNSYPTKNPFQTNLFDRDASVSKFCFYLLVLPGGQLGNYVIFHPTTGISPASGMWLINDTDAGTITSVQWGTSGDKIAPADYDGDAVTDFAVFRPSNGTWYIKQSSDDGVRAQQWGLATDVHVPADYDGDGKADIAVFRPSDGAWYVFNSSDGGVTVVLWGANGDKPAPADYDGDGEADIAVFRPSDGTWYIRNSYDESLRVEQWGTSEDRPLPMDYDGDGLTDIAVFRPSNGSWYILNSYDGSLYAAQWGTSSDVPVPGDYDGDLMADVAIWRPATGTWYVLQSSDGSLVQQQFGSSGDVPVTSAYLPE